jgi:hypothetical protein
LKRALQGEQRASTIVTPLESIRRRMRQPYWSVRRDEVPPVGSSSGGASSPQSTQTNRSVLAPADTAPELRMPGDLSARTELFRRRARLVSEVLGLRSADMSSEGERRVALG